MSRKILVLLSGGLDSSVMLMKLREANEVAAVFFNRGQSNLKSEHAAVIEIVTRAECHLDEIDITSWWAATAGKVRMLDVPRNPIFALLASPFAIIQSCGEIAIGSTLDDANTGDSNAEFVGAFNHLVKVMGLKDMPQLVAPWLELGWSKRSVAGWARDNLGQNFINMTHSCWKEIPCGTCPACIAREAALRDIGAAD
jgi:7-cyano-7-deazaguanine synthase in queuosine biosynthesis